MSEGHVVGKITAEVAQQKLSVHRTGEKLLVKRLEENGWVDCSKGAGVIWVHTDLRNPADQDQVFITFEDAVEIQSRWELNWPHAHVVFTASPAMESGESS